jgi:hypothetical protein
MSATLSSPPKLQFFTAGGIPLVGGHLYTYAAGTTTPLASYTDASGTTQNPVDIVLDSRGEAPNGVWLNGASYKFVLASADAPAVAIWTVDNINAQEAINDLLAFEALLAGSTGSTLVGFTQTGPGTTRTVQSKLSDSYSVADFGFSTSASAAANTTAFANAWNISRQLTIPAGTYNVGALPNFAILGARIYGIGRVVLNITGAGPGLVVDAGAAPSTTVVQDIVIDNLTINCTGAATIGVFIRGITHSQFNRLRPINFPAYAMLCNFMVSNSFYDFCHSGNEPGITVPSVIGVGLGKRNVGEQCSNCTWINPVIEGTSGNGLVLDEAAASVFIGGTVEGCGYTSGYGGILIGSNSFDNTFINMDLEANGILGDATTFHVKCAGLRTSFVNLFADAGEGNVPPSTAGSPLIWIYGGNSTAFFGGSIQSLKIEAGVKNTVTNSLAYNIGAATGTITDAGTNTRHIQLYSVNPGTTLPDSYVTKSTWTPVATSLTIVGTPTYVGTFERIGDFVSFTIRVTSTTSTAATAGATSFSTPTSTVVAGTCVAASNVTALGFGTGLVNSNVIYVPTWAASADVVITGQYFAA